MSSTCARGCSSIFARRLPRLGRRESGRATAAFRSSGWNNSTRDAAGDGGARPPLILDLDPHLDPSIAREERVRVRFLTPTELKSGGALAKRPEFAVLFGRLRDRISTLRALYGAGALDLDFRAVGERAAKIRMVH